MSDIDLLTDFRKYIRFIDESIVAFLIARITFSKKIGAIKKLNKWPVQNHEVEEEIFEMINRIIKEQNLDASESLLINEIFTKMISHSKKVQEQTKSSE